MSPMGVRRGSFFPMRANVWPTWGKGVLHRSRADSSSTGRNGAIAVSFSEEYEGRDGILNGVQGWVDVCREAEGGPNGPGSGSAVGAAGGDSIGHIFRNNAEVIFDTSSGPRWSHCDDGCVGKWALMVLSDRRERKSAMVLDAPGTDMTRTFNSALRETEPRWRRR